MVKIQNWGYCFGLLKFFGMHEIPDICFLFFFFCGGTVDAGPEPMYEEKNRVPPPPPAWGLRAVLGGLKGPFECETKLNPRFNLLNSECRTSNST